MRGFEVASAVLVLSLAASCNAFAVSPHLPLRSDKVASFANLQSQPFRPSRNSAVTSTCSLLPVKHQSGKKGEDSTFVFDQSVILGLQKWWPRVSGAFKVGFATFVAAVLMFAPTTVLAQTSESGGRLGGGSFYNRVEQAPPPTPSYESSRPSVTFQRDYERDYERDRPRVVTQSRPATAEEERVSAIIFVGVAGLMVYAGTRSNGSESLGGAPLNVVKLQVAVFCPNRGPSSVLGKINSLAASADTTSQAGLVGLVEEMAVALLRSEDDWLSGALSSSAHPDPSKAERAFTSLSLKERSKIQRETVNRVDGQNRADPRKPEASLEAIGTQTAAVITLLLGFDDATLPKVNDRESMKKALREMAAVAQEPNKLLQAELLWTPEEPWEIVMPSDVPLSYPDLIPFN
eukprot:CAMPEP_0181299050 /NCGR_PEP_ID=MMETSP1101-20121128/6124_1 /TAXON_ID=46948 /ORGANISM="Rhodomonas abbreviata, Strain Caron Lab Isolate" /LENGTH=404 /DNA_ID=CAMNT_0023404143 /DNA_START=21 /DNA_END=1235 /DNA_ORIENTATION=-